MLLVIAIFLAACGLNSKERNGYGKDETNIQTSIEESKIPGIEIETEIGEYSTYKYALHFPRTKNEKINIEIQNFVSQQRQEFLELVKETEIEDGLFSELNLNFEISHFSNSFLSIVFSSNTNIPETTNATHTYTLNFDCSTNKILTLEKLLKGEESLVYLQELLERQLIQDEQLVELVREDKVLDGLSPKLQNYKTFSLSDQSLNVYFNSDQFQDSEVQPFNIALSYNTLTGIIDSSFLQSIYRVASTDTEVLSEAISDENSEAKALDPTKKYVALTFDDGPHKDMTPRILDILKKYNAKATFYVLGNRVSYYPDVVKRAYEEGHEIGNHTWTHPDLTNLSKEELLKEIDTTSNEIAKVTGKAPTTIRPPYGAFNDALKQYLNMPIITWSVDTLDWKHRNKEKITQTVQNMTTNGSIILMHDIHESSADALEDILVNLTQQGYHFVTVSELLELNNPAVAYAGQVFSQKKSQ